jgi:hypothetical protein
MITRGRLTVMKKAAHFHVEQTGHERLVNTLHSLEVIYGIRTTEAENDIEQATNIARRMVTRWGMSDELDMVALAPRENAFIGDGAPGSWSAEKPYSEKTAEKIDAEIERIVGGAMRKPGSSSRSTEGSSTRSPGRSLSARRWRRKRSWRSPACLGHHASQTASSPSRTPPMLTRTVRISDERQRRRRVREPARSVTQGERSGVWRVTTAK